ncbi:MAG: ABC transporter permease [Alkalibacterium sp.]|nr:ABC transporter permease [Alkalibacterium sp.]
MSLSVVFKKRALYYYKQLGKYLKYVFNDHFVIALLILVGALGFAYSDYVETVSADAFLPRIILVSVLFSAVTIGGIRTLIKPADGIFLLPLEKELIPIMHKHLLVSILFFSAGMMLIATATMPLLEALGIVPNAFSFSWAATLILLKVVDLLTLYYLFEMTSSKNDSLVTNLKNSWILILLSLSLFISVTLGLIVTFLSAVILFSLLFVRKKVTIWNWEKLIDTEQKRVQTIYRLINLFIETPYGKNKVKRRRPLDHLIELFDKNTNPHMYYMVRVFFRQTTFSGLYFRLCLIGLIFVLFSPTLWLRLVGSLLFIYLIGFQLLPLKQILDESIHFKLYPYKNTDKIKAIQKFLGILLMVSSVLFSIGSFNGGWDTMGVIFVASTLFVWGFVRIYVPKRLGR